MAAARFVSEGAWGCRADTPRADLPGGRGEARGGIRRDAFAKYGPDRILIPQPDAHFDGLVIEVEPLRSRRTRNELAMLIQEGEIYPVNAEINRLEDELKSLLPG